MAERKGHVSEYNVYCMLLSDCADEQSRGEQSHAQLMGRLWTEKQFPQTFSHEKNTYNITKETFFPFITHMAHHMTDHNKKYGTTTKLCTASVHKCYATYLQSGAINYTLLQHSSPKKKAKAPPPPPLEVTPSSPPPPPVPLEQTPSPDTKKRKGEEADSVIQSCNKKRIRAMPVGPRLDVTKNELKEICDLLSICPSGPKPILYKRILYHIEVNKILTAEVKRICTVFGLSTKDTRFEMSGRLSEHLKKIINI